MTSIKPLPLNLRQKDSSCLHWIDVGFFVSRFSPTATADMIAQQLVLLSLALCGALAQTFNPTLTVDSCTKSLLEITLTDAADNGIVYIQGQDSACRQFTTTGTSTHSIDFASCNIQWEETFKIVVQKNQYYQTGADKQIPVMCIADLADLTVSDNLVAANKDDDAGQNKTVKPTATMALYSGGNSVSGSTVKLTDTITMVMQLDSEYIEDFDIKARSCVADTIDIVTDYCPVDTYLFPVIQRTTQGVIQAEFGAFRTTSLSGDPVPMVFSCTLQVCLGACSATTCTDGSSSYGRKKRSLTKRQAEPDNVVEDISVGTSLKIATDEVVIEGPGDESDVCLNQGVFIVLIIFLVGGMLASTIAAVVMFKKLQEKAGILSKLGGSSMGMSVPVA
ncbi:uncharacterized protein LOC123556033 [Mercenaria mercenaria]|uniref:uncharacterized protein LOC123556033 n=1 Tax=Mercenaria mercenaria TaxID=6596 RepID=UPI00234EFB79|nr:uncharacterized protein LOC123556033 [Mercenaria mercenaria]